MNRETARPLAVLLVAVFVVSSTMVVGVSAGVAPATGDAAVDASEVSAETAGASGGDLAESTGATAGSLQTSDDPADPADEIYVKENGDAVLVYENSSDGGTAEFGTDVSADVFYALVEAPVERDTGARAELTSTITPDRLTANGSLVVPRTDDLGAVEEFSLDASGVTTNDTNRFDASASATINDSELEGDTGIPVESASVSGNLSTTPSRFRTATEFDATLLQPIGPERHEQFTLTETDGDYTVDASRDYVVSDFVADSYDTRSEAEETIEAQFGSVAEQFGGSAEVTIQSYDFDDTANRLDIEYTVEYTGVEQGLAETIGAQLANSEDIDLSPSEIETFETRFQRLNIDEVSTRIDQEGTSVSGYFRADLRNYDEWVRAGLTLAEAAESEAITQPDIDRVRNRLEAQEDADFRQRFEYTASLDRPDDQLTSVSADLQYRTTNWDAFVDALGNRGGVSVDREFDLTARTEGDEIIAEGSLNVSGRDVIEDAVKDGFNRSDAEMTRFARALRSAELEKAKFDLSLDGETVRIEAGAKFENLSEARDALDEASGVPRFTEIVGRTEGDTVRSYVYVENAVDPGASEEDVRALPYVDSETRVFMSGEWDREFPSVDTQRAADFLGVSLDPGDGDGDGGATVTLQPASSEVALGRPITYDVVVSGIDGGVGSYDIVVNASDTARARVVDATATIGSGDVDVAGDGSGARIRMFGADTSDTGPVTVGTVTVEGVATGDVDLAVTTNGLSDETGTPYTVSSSTGASLSVVEPIEAPVVVPGSPATDPDGDGVYEDLDGSGDFTVTDVQLMFAVYTSDDRSALQDAPGRFDFNEDGRNEVTIGDIQALFAEYTSE